MMLAVYIGNNLGFALHYALLDHWTAVAMNGLMGVQTVAAIGLVHHPRLRLAYLAFIPFMAGVTIATWQGLPSLLAAAATTLSTAGRMQGKETLLRVLLLAAMPFWAVHDLAVGSLPGLIADLLSMAIGAAMLLRRPPRARNSRERTFSVRPAAEI
jgi:inner membrane protein